MRHIVPVVAIVPLSLLLAGCVSKHSEMGVQNRWRAPDAAQFARGVSTQSDVMRELGPPSQVIDLRDQAIFYYLREQCRTSALITFAYNYTSEEIDYDRAIFFFDTKGVLTDFAYSREAAPFEE